MALAPTYAQTAPIIPNIAEPTTTAVSESPMLMPAPSSAPRTYEDLESDIDDYIQFYNYKRLQGKLNGLSPMKFRTKAAS